MLNEAKRYRSGNSWLTAWHLDKPVEVPVIGHGFTVVNPGQVLIATDNPNWYDVTSEENFFKASGYEEVEIHYELDQPFAVEDDSEEVTENDGD